jgi:hypothetical protein
VVVARSVAQGFFGGGEWFWAHCSCLGRSNEKRVAVKA